ncbi:MAG: sugar phosphate isomerase/epimerase family protein [Pirellulaceae bacterium]|nr:sugar phosphate isomerase/epimerase family protein [Pirellulaceae bacterium]
MICSAVTVSLVEEARGGPFVFWDDLPGACRAASELGYDAIELFAPSPTAVAIDELKSLLEKHRLQLAAVGTGAGMVKHGLNLTDPDPQKREAAKNFIRSMIDYGSQFNAPAIIGSMQGRWGNAIDRGQALSLLGAALNELGEHAASLGVTLIYEPLNRYETNLIKTVADGVAFLNTVKTKNVRLLADLFHMNIEEANVADAIRVGKGAIGHIHFVDSNRQACGLGHTDFVPIMKAIREIGYDGYLSAEAFALPDSLTAATATMKAYKALQSNI